MLGPAVQLDERVEHRVSDRISKRRIRFRDASDVFGNSNRFVLVQRAEEEHVPVIGQLLDERRKLFFELRIEHDVVLEDQNAG